MARFLEGGLEPEPRGECQRHAESCNECGELLVLASLGDVGLEGPIGFDFTASVLEATSGFSCDSVAFELAETQNREQLGMRTMRHLSDCDSCRRLDAALLAIPRDLKGLRSFPVDALFADQVLARTLPIRQKVARWWLRTWPNWVQRPRFATELAYVLTVALLVVVGNPTAPLAALSERASDLEAPVSVDLSASTQVLESELNAVVQSVKESTFYDNVETSVDGARGGAEKLQGWWSLSVDTLANVWHAISGSPTS